MSPLLPPMHKIRLEHPEKRQQLILIESAENFIVYIVIPRHYLA